MGQKLKRPEGSLDNLLSEVEKMLSSLGVGELGTILGVCGNCRKELGMGRDSRRNRCHNRTSRPPELAGLECDAWHETGVGVDGHNVKTASSQKSAAPIVGYPKPGGNEFSKVPLRGSFTGSFLST